MYLCANLSTVKLKIYLHRETFGLTYVLISRNSPGPNERLCKIDPLSFSTTTSELVEMGVTLVVVLSVLLLGIFALFVCFCTFAVFATG